MEISAVLLSLRANVEYRDGNFGDVLLDRAKPHVRIAVGGRVEPGDA